MAKRLLNEVSKGKNMFGVEVVKKLYILGRSQLWLAEQCNCTKQHISQLIHGKRKPSLHITEKIAEVFDMKVEEVRKLVLEEVA